MYNENKLQQKAKLFVDSVFSIEKIERKQTIRSNGKIISEKTTDTFCVGLKMTYNEILKKLQDFKVNDFVFYHELVRQIYDNVRDWQSNHYNFYDSINNPFNPKVLEEKIRELYLENLEIDIQEPNLNNNKPSKKQLLLILDYQGDLPNREINKSQTAKAVSQQFGFSYNTIRDILTNWGKNSEHNPLTKENLEYVISHFEQKGNKDIVSRLKKDLEQLVENQLNKNKKRK